MASGAKADLVRSIGARRVIDYTTTPIDADGATYDLVIDIGGRTPLRQLRRIVATAGTLVIVGGDGGNRLTGGIGRQLRAAATSLFTRQRLTMFASLERGSSIERLAELMADGRVVPVIHATVGLDEVPDAITDLVAGRVTGKVVIDVAGAS